MKKTILALILCLSVFTTTGCAGFFLDLFSDSSSSTAQTSDPADYGQFNDNIHIPSYYPESISAYTVNEYGYHTEQYTGLCYEIYLDVTLTEDAFNSVLAAARNDTRVKTTSIAYHSSSFMEITFKNDYTPSYIYYDAAETADIEKVIYSESELRIIFVLLHVDSDGSYPVNNIKYFSKLEIDHSKYSANGNNQI